MTGTEPSREAPQVELLEDPRGEVRIWQHPEPGKLYVIGADTSGGKEYGDYGAAVVIETLSRAMVASIKGKYDPNKFARMLSLLGWYFNEGMVAIETHPSQHGLAAAHHLLELGYSMVYRRLQETTISRRLSNEIGWATTARTKGILEDQVHQALSEKWDIPCAELLTELGQARVNDQREVEFEEHDDYYTAYAIAQRVSKLMVSIGYVSEERPPARTWQQRYWKARNEALEAGARGENRPKSRCWDGC